jgi:hypothetical protein
VCFEFNISHQKTSGDVQILWAQAYSFNGCNDFGYGNLRCNWRSINSPIHGDFGKSKFDPLKHTTKHNL